MSKKYTPTKYTQEEQAEIAKLCWGFSAIHTSGKDKNPLPDEFLKHYGSIIGKLVEYGLIKTTFEIE